MSAALFTYLPPLFTYLCAMSAKGCLPRKPRYIINTPKMTARDNQSIWCLKMFVIWREITASHWRCVYESVLVNISCPKVTSRWADNRAAEETAPLKLKGEVLQSKIQLKKKKNFDGDNLASLKDWQYFTSNWLKVHFPAQFNKSNISIFQGFLW